MCGRYLLSSSLGDIIERFSITLNDEFEWTPRYNLAPTQESLVVVINNDGIRQLSKLSWGLIPHWSKEKSIENKLINARGETILEKPSFKESFLRRRCIIPSDGFYEWLKDGSKKRPFRIGLKNNDLFGFAGLWDSWKESADTVIHSFTIITVEANQLIAPIHNRMPVILLPEYEEKWLNPQENPEELLSIMQPYPDEQMSISEVSPLVNSPRNDFEQLTLPI